MSSRPTGVSVRRIAVRRWCAPAIACALAIVVSAGPTIAQPIPGTGTGTSADDQRLAQLERQTDLAMKLDPAAARTEDLIPAITTIDQYVRSQMALYTNADLAQKDAERRAADFDAQLAATQGEYDVLTGELREEAVRLYVDPDSHDKSLRLLKEDSVSDAEKRRVIGEIRSGRKGSLTEQFRVLKAQRDQIQAEAATARDEARRNEQLRKDIYTRVVRGQETLGRLQAAFDKKISESTDEADANELDKAIADARSKLAPADATPASTGRMEWPTAGVVSSRFGMRNGSPHEGIDIAASSGTPIVAALGGRVVLAGYSGDYGYLVAIDHANGLQTRYAHMLKSLQVSSGQTVNQGQRIGSMGSTGDSTGPHLHFEVRLNGRPQNPLNYLPARG